MTDDLKWILKNNNKSLAILSFFIIHENFRKTIYQTFKKKFGGWNLNDKQMSSHLTDEGVVTPTISIVPCSVLQHFYTVLMFSTIWFPRQPVAEGHWEIGIFPFELAFLFLVIESDPQTTIINVDWHT